LYRASGLHARIGSRLDADAEPLMGLTLLAKAVVMQPGLRKQLGAQRVDFKRTVCAAARTSRVGRFQMPVPVTCLQQSEATPGTDAA